MEIFAKRVAKVLLLTVLLLTVFGVAAAFANHFLRPYIEKHFLAFYVAYVFIREFGLDLQGTISDWFQTSVLLLCSFLLATIAVAKSREEGTYALHWKALPVLVLLPCIDEAVSIHDLTVEPLRSVLHTSGFFYYAWVIPAGIAILTIGTVYLRFLINLPAHTRWLFLAAGVIYLGGALGMELVEGDYASRHGEANITFALMAVVEESLEMLGIVVFLYALISYVAVHVGTIGIRFKSE